MTALEWDKPGDRYFEAGLDRGVIFYGSQVAAWNGLIGINEETAREVKSYYLDGIKYLDHHVPGAYSAKVDAFTYPDLLDELTGTMRYAPGVFLHDQSARIFDLSYRTGLGNDLDPELGYKLHIVYNVLAVPSGTQISTNGDSAVPAAFSWDLSGTPPVMFGARPTCHISLQSNAISPELLQAIEDLLYGTEDTDPSLPPLDELLVMVEAS